QIRADNALPPGKPIEVLLVADAAGGTALGDEAATIGRLTRSEVRVVSRAGAAAAGAAAHAVLGGGVEVIVPLAGLVDVTKECERLRGELDALVRQITSREQRLSNEKYVAKAPPHVVESDRAILAEMRGKREQIDAKVR